MKKIRWTSFIYLVLWPAFVTCYPSAPGTCNMDLMGTIGHGPSKSTCDDCYRILVHPSSSIDNSLPSLSDISIKIVGTQSYQGLMLLVKDHANQTVGRFVDFDETMFAPVACDDESIEEESVAVIGHLDPRIKSWPIQVGWQADQGLAQGDYRVQGMVVIDYDNFHMIPEKAFKLGPTPSRHTTTLDKTTIGIESTTSTRVIVETDTVDLETVEWPLESVNPLFLKVVMVLMFIYVAMSLILRHLMKHRQQCWNLRCSSVMDQEGTHRS